MSYLAGLIGSLELKSTTTAIHIEGERVTSGEILAKRGIVVSGRRIVSEDLDAIEIEFRLCSVGALFEDKVVVGRASILFGDGTDLLPSGDAAAIRDEVDDLWGDFDADRATVDPAGRNDRKITNANEQPVIGA